MPLSLKPSIGCWLKKKLTSADSKPQQDLAHFRYFLCHQFNCHQIELVEPNFAGDQLNSSQSHYQPHLQLPRYCWVDFYFQLYYFKQLPQWSSQSLHLISILTSSLPRTVISRTIVNFLVELFQILVKSKKVKSVPFQDFRPDSENWQELVMFLEMRFQYYQNL